MCYQNEEFEGNLCILNLTIQVVWKGLVREVIGMIAAAAAELLQSCPTLCDPIHGSSLGSSVPGILQARILEWVAISFSNAWKWSHSVVPDS